MRSSVCCKTSLAMQVDKDRSIQSHFSANGGLQALLQRCVGIDLAYLLAIMLQLASHTTSAAAVENRNTEVSQKTILVTATPGSLQAKTWFDKQWSDQEYTCADFYVRAVAQDVPEIFITVAGAGQAALFPVDDKRPVKCAESPSAASLLVLHDVKQELRKIRLRLAPSSFPESGKSVDARIILFTPPKESIELGLRLEGETHGAIWTAASWFFGIMISAMLTAVVGYGAYRGQQSYTAKKSQDNEFEQFVTDQWSDLEKLFTEYYPTLEMAKQSDKIWADELGEKIAQMGIFNKLPLKKRDTLRTALGMHKRMKIKHELASIFHQWKSEILTSSTKSDNSQ